jgi:hypothetical protein
MTVNRRVVNGLGRSSEGKNREDLSPELGTINTK